MRRTNNWSSNISNTNSVEPMMIERTTANEYLKLEGAPHEHEHGHRHVREYNILRSLRGYKVGAPIRKADMIICNSQDAAAYALQNFQPKDCAFILRSGGTFTYALYEGPDERDPTALSFQVDERGHFKVVPRKQFLARVKVPALPKKSTHIGSSFNSIAMVEFEDDDDAKQGGAIDDPSDALALTILGLQSQSIGSSQSHDHQASNPFSSRPLSNSERSQRSKIKRGGIQSSHIPAHNPNVNPQTNTGSVPRRSSHRRPQILRDTMKSNNLGVETVRDLVLHEPEPSEEHINGHGHRNGERGEGHAHGQVHALQPKPDLARQDTIRAMNSNTSSRRGTIKVSNGHANTDMMKTSRDNEVQMKIQRDNEVQMKMARLTSKLNINDKAYIRRSGGTFSLAVVKAKNEVSITFAVNSNGDTKTVDLMNAWKYVKLVEKQREDGIAGEEQDMLKQHESLAKEDRAARFGVRGRAVKRGSMFKAQRPPSSGTGGMEEASRFGMTTTDMENAMKYVQLMEEKGDLKEEEGMKTMSTTTVKAEKEAGGGDEISRSSRRRGSDPPMPRGPSFFASISQRRRSSACVPSYDAVAHDNNEAMAMSAAMAKVRQMDSEDTSLDDSFRGDDDGTLDGTVKTAVTRRWNGGAAGYDTATDDWEELMDDSLHVNQTEANAKAESTPDNVEPPIQVECKTEDGQMKTVPLYKEGMHLYYIKQGEDPIPATILEVYFNGVFEPYYTIDLGNGREKQTDNDHLTLEEHSEITEKQEKVLHEVGMDVYYKRQNEKTLAARILDVHLDDELEPYYTIKLEDGREKQTDNGHLTLEMEDELMCITNGEEENYKVGMSVQYKRQNEDPVAAKILDVHLDELLEPYYTIQLEDGREKQTDSAHIMS